MSRHDLLKGVTANLRPDDLIEIRPCRPEDFEGVVALLRQLWPADLSVCHV